ncbi:MAG: PTS sugar transporter subunit IIA [Treponema sp.]|jgi:PTS system nitrogen regulatory IIA component|nr:PTS sugar transporter subunit IIA [Treponema sp.]
MDKEKTTLTQLVKHGGIFYKIEGANKKEILINLIDALPPSVLPAGKRDTLLKAVIEREALISTGIENGIALPHPRTPLLEAGEPPFVAIAFSRQPIDWETPDNKPVHTIFLIVSDSPKQHLNALTNINFLCMNKNFYNLITAQAAKEEILAAIGEAEKGWRR